MTGAQRGDGTRPVFPTPTPVLPDGWRVQDVTPGDSLVATVAGGEELDCIAADHYQPSRGKGWGAVVPVKFTTKGEPMPWPAEYLRPAGLR